MTWLITETALDKLRNLLSNFKVSLYKLLLIYSLLEYLNQLPLVDQHPISIIRRILSGIRASTLALQYWDPWTGWRISAVDQMVKTDWVKERSILHRRHGELPVVGLGAQAAEWSVPPRFGLSGGSIRSGVIKLKLIVKLSIQTKSFINREIEWRWWFLGDWWGLYSCHLGWLGEAHTVGRACLSWACKLTGPQQPTQCCICTTL